jgi:hypothetical protein
MRSMGGEIAGRGGGSGRSGGSGGPRLISFGLMMMAGRGGGAGGGGGLDCALADVTAPAVRSASKVDRIGAMARSVCCCDTHNICPRGDAKRGHMA